MHGAHLVPRRQQEEEGGEDGEKAPEAGPQSHDLRGGAHSILVMPPLSPAVLLQRYCTLDAQPPRREPHLLLSDGGACVAAQQRQRPATTSPTDWPGSSSEPQHVSFLKCSANRPRCHFHQ